jgi:ferrous-iron efflux pump FieF
MAPMMLQDSAHTTRLIVWATRASVAVALFLLLLKLYGWMLTGSVGLLATLVDSLIDLFASLINLFAVRWAFTPPDSEHRFGHGKAEALAGLGQAAFILSSSIFLLLTSVERLLSPKIVEEVATGTAIILISLLATLALIAFQRYVIRRTGSVAVKADRLHYVSDVLCYLGIGIALPLAGYGYFFADPLIGLAIGIFIASSAFRIGYDAVQLLMDRELPEQERQQVLDIARAGEGVLEVHGLRTRQSGQMRFIQLHLVFDGRRSLLETHTLSDRVEERLRQAFQNADILIHQDPHTEAVSLRAREAAGAAAD